MAYAKNSHPPLSPDKPIMFRAEPYHFAVPDRELLDDLIAVARKLDSSTVMPQQYSKHGRFSTTIIRQRFLSWNAALVVAKLQPSHPPRVQNEIVLRDIAQVAKKLGVRDLRRGDYTREGRFATTTISRRFGSWTAAKLAAGLTAIQRPPRNATNQMLFENFERLWRSLGRQPRGRDIALPHSKYNITLYRSRFGTFRAALASFIHHQKQAGKLTAAYQAIEMPIRHKTHREVRANLRYEILKRDRFRCVLCGRSPAIDPAVQLQIDHKKPWSLGGETTPDNLQTLCETCNAGKSNSSS